jgi:hypothetical protein
MADDEYDMPEPDFDLVPVDFNPFANDGLTRRAELHAPARVSRRRQAVLRPQAWAAAASKGRVLIIPCAYAGLCPLRSKSAFARLDAMDQFPEVADHCASVQHSSPA